MEIGHVARGESDAPGMLLLIIDRNGQVELAEGEALASLGLEAGDLTGRAVAEVFERWPQLRHGIDEALAEQSTSARVWADGHALEVQFAPRHDGAGTLAGALVSGLDAARIEEREQRLRDQERHLRLVFRQVPGAIWATDRELRITYALGNPPERAGFDVDHITGTSVYDILGTHDPSHPVIANHLAALAGRRVRFQVEFRRLWFEIHIRPLRDTRGAIVGCVAAGIDQTERCRTERELARSKAQLVEAQRMARVGSFEWDIATDRLFWSDEFSSAFGIDPGELGNTLETFFSHVHPDDVDGLKTSVLDAVRDAAPLEKDVRIIWPDGSDRVFHGRSETVTDDAGKPIRMIACFQDVTEARRTTRELEQSVSLMRATLEATADGILVVDCGGKITTYNQRFLELWRIPPEVAAQGDDETLLDRVRSQLEDPQGFLRGVRARYAQSDSEALDELRFSDGRVYERHSRPQWIGDEIVGRVWSFRDVTAHRKLLRRTVFLADAARLLASLDVESALEGVARLAVPDLFDAYVVDLLEPTGSRRLIEVCREGIRCISREPHPAVLAGHATTYKVEGTRHLGVPLVSQRGLLGVITLALQSERRDGADDIELAEELGRRATLALDNARAYRDVRDALRARDEFLSIAAHELRGPLTAMTLAAQSLETKVVAPARVPSLLNIIVRENQRLTRLADDLVDVGSIRAGRLGFELEDVDLGDVVRDSAARLRDDITKSRSSLSISTEGNLVGNWDRFRLEQVVTNLLSNAIKFGLGRPIELRARADDGRVVMTVRDHGIGVPPDRREQIFRPFDRAVSSRHYGGLGLGLYIVRNIVEGFGGTVVAEAPAEGDGAMFVVDLPRVRTA